MYSGWPGHYNNVGYSARLKTSFELNPVTEGNKGPFLSFKWNGATDLSFGPDLVSAYILAKWSLFKK